MDSACDYKIDQIDQKLIQELQKNGRQPYVYLAKMLQVSEGTVRARVKNLLDRNIIKITAVPNPHAMGYDFIGIVALQIRIADLAKVAEELNRAPNVCYLANVTGRYEFIAIVIAPSAREFSDFVEKVISAVPGITRTETFVTLKTFKGCMSVLDLTQLVANFQPDTHQRKRLGSTS